jgi:hypothetical protein
MEWTIGRERSLMFMFMFTAVTTYDSDCDSLSDNVNSLMIISIPLHQIISEKGILVVKASS